MNRIIIFGGTTEGRKLCEFCSDTFVQVTYCVATSDGARPVEGLQNIQVRVGRMDARQMEELLANSKPAFVIDATHPYAAEVSRNIGLTCQNTGFELLRISRECAEEPGCVAFDKIDNMIDWLTGKSGNIFNTLGSSYAKAFRKLPDYQNRVWMRVLPSMENVCLDLGYHPERLICAQGPFSEDANRAIFKAADARILVTKNAGSVGGFPEKVMAARSLGMLIAVLERPETLDGISLNNACKRIRELSI